ncbi:Titin [Taenia solium]|eukprot:TsM_000866100 transcript=TsM_000866100 gene=TsM_000866100
MVFGPLGPSNPTVTAVSRTEVVVSWEPPDQFLQAQLKRYEVYINTSTKPSYSGTQTFCHLRGLRANCQYHFKVRMVLEREGNVNKTTLNSKREVAGAGKGRRHGEKFQSLSSTHKRRRQAPDKSHTKIFLLECAVPRSSREFRFVPKPMEEATSTSLPQVTQFTVAVRRKNRPLFRH